MGMLIRKVKLVNSDSEISHCETEKCRQPISNLRGLAKGIVCPVDKAKKDH